MKTLAEINIPNLQIKNFDLSSIIGLEIIEREICNSVAETTGVIRDMCSHILNAGGKRERFAQRHISVMGGFSPFFFETVFLIRADISATR